MVAAGLPVPPGFAVAAGGPREAASTPPGSASSRSRAHDEAQELVLTASAAPGGDRCRLRGVWAGAVAVRSSACAEDSEAASFAGQQETFLGVAGADVVCARVVECWASFFSERALFYRSDKGSLDDLGMAVVVQRMVEAEQGGRDLHRRPRPAPPRPDDRRGGVRAWRTGRLRRGDARSLRGRRERRVKREGLVGAGGCSHRAELARARRARSPARGALRRASGRRVGDRGRTDLPAPVEAGDDPLSSLLERAHVWVGPYWNARHLERTLDWLLVLEPDASEPMRLAALTHDMEGGTFPGARDRPGNDAARRRDLRACAFRAIRASGR